MTDLIERTTKPDQEYTSLERCVLDECLKMETQYAVDVPLPESGLGTLDLIKEP